MLNELTFPVSVSVFSNPAQYIAMVFSHMLALGRKFIKVRYSIIKRIFINMVDQFSMLNHIIRVMLIPNKMRSRNVASLIYSRIKHSVFGRNPYVHIISTPLRFCFIATLKKVVLRARATELGSYFLSHSSRSFIGASPRTIARRFPTAMDTFSFFLANGANKFCFHNSNYNMVWSKTL